MCDAGCRACQVPLLWPWVCVLIQSGISVSSPPSSADGFSWHRRFSPLDKEAAKHGLLAQIDASGNVYVEDRIETPKHTGSLIRKTASGSHLDLASHRSSPRSGEHLYHDHRPSVTSACGPIDGTWLRDGVVAAFRGIRYGKAPIGSRRFLPAEAAECWTGRLDATEDGAACLQLDDKDDDPPRETSEDCLNLNVFVTGETPRRLAAQHHNNRQFQRDSASDALMPVVVFIYGGNLAWGSVTTNGPLDVFVERAAQSGAPFVLLAMNYRLHALGFAALPELAKGDPRGVAGNYGIMDQILALQWARKNIHAFGGDSSRVTLFGQSSGGTSIFGLLAAPSARGLFHSVISSSGSPNVTMGRGQKEKQDREMWLPRTPCAHFIGDELAHCLRTVPACKLAKALDASYSAWGYSDEFLRVGNRGIGWAALLYVDGVTVAEPVEQALASGKSGNVNILLQNMQCEDGDASPSELRSLKFLKQKLDRTGGISVSADIVRQYKKLAEHFAGSTSRKIKDTYAFTAFITDVAATCGNVALARAAAEGGLKNVFVGTVVQGLQAPMEVMLQTEGCERAHRHVPFHSMDLQTISAWAVATAKSSGSNQELVGADRVHAGVWKKYLGCSFVPAPEDIALAEEIWNHWLAFISTGKPQRTWREFGVQTSYEHAVVGHRPGATTTISGWKAGICHTAMSKLHMGREYWWIN